MTDIVTLTAGLSLGLLFVLIVTKAYIRSISTTIYVISLSIAMQTYVMGECEIAFLIVIAGAVSSLMRAVINHNVDTVLKRN